MITTLLSGLTTKFAGLGFAAKAGLGLSMATASLTGAGAAGVLPEPVQKAVERIAPVGPAEQADPKSEFGEQVNSDATDDDKGVDGSVISDDARNLGDERRQDGEHRPADAGAPSAPGSKGLDRASQTPASGHVPSSVPAGPGTADKYRPEVPSGQPKETPGNTAAPVAETPADQPDAPGTQPTEIPSGQPQDTPTGAPEDVPAGRPAR